MLHGVDGHRYRTGRAGDPAPDRGTPHTSAACHVRLVHPAARDRAVALGPAPPTSAPRPAVANYRPPWTTLNPSKHPDRAAPRPMAAYPGAFLPRVQVHGGAGHVEGVGQPGEGDRLLRSAGATCIRSPTEPIPHGPFRRCSSCPRAGSVQRHRLWGPQGAGGAGTSARGSPLGADEHGADGSAEGEGGGTGGSTRGQPQADAYERFAEEPTRPELERFFLLGDANILVPVPGVVTIAVELIHLSVAAIAS